MCIFFKAPIKFGWETSLQMCTFVGNGPSETKGKDSIWGSSGWGLLDDQRKLGSSFRVTDNYICETGKWWLREAVTLDWYYIAWKTHNLKMALRVYDALQNSRCCPCRRIITTEDCRNIGLGYVSNMHFALFVSTPWLLFARHRTLHCMALTHDSVIAAVTLLNAHWTGAERRLSESDASWVRSVFADGEVSLIDLLKCHDENLAF